MSADPIADMLTRIRNSLEAKHEVLTVPASKVCQAILGVLKLEGYISDFKKMEDEKQGLLRIYLKYGPSGERLINDLKRVSKLSRRVYRGAADLPRPMDGLGISIVSTSHGVMSDRQCREKKVGGEVLCIVS
jgi:small subunit ribosomal protein S8